MKKRSVLGLKKFLVVSLALILGGCSFAYQVCPHADANHDRICDLCSQELSMLDNKCLNCGNELVNGECDTCNKGVVEEEKKCTTCGGTLTDGKCATCDKAPVEEEKKCATCGGTLTNGKCVTCDKPVENKCATCGGTLTDGKCATCDKEEEKELVSLDGKKIIFIGNSYTYYGQTVIRDTTSLTQAKRSNNKGYFYQLCKANGAEVNVTNWTFDGHNIRWLFNGSCGATNKDCVGEDHASYLTDKYFDYVVLQPGKEDVLDDATLTELEAVLNFFKTANPNVKFVLLVPYHCYGTIGSSLITTKNYLNRLKTHAGEGMIVSDWGGLVMDILNKKVTVPGSTISYTKNTFVIAKSAKDGYHPNLLSGYITTLMTYCAITGDKAQGQTYAFCNDESLSPKAGSYLFSFTNFISEYYKPDYGTTNFDQVFASKTDMSGIQGLIDAHLSAKAYMNYKY